MEFPRAIPVALFSVIAGCIPSFAPRLPVPPLPADRAVTAIAFDRAGEHLWVSRRGEAGCALSRMALGDRSSHEIAQLPFCPDQITLTSDDLLLLASAAQSFLIDSSGRDAANGRHIIAARSVDVMIEQADGQLWWQRRGLRTALPGGARSPRLLQRSEGVLAIQGTGESETVVRITPEGAAPLTPMFRRVDSFDVSPDEKEIVFSADAGKGFDVGLAPVEGGEVRWIFPDPLPERGVTWAPRGNKVTYRIESPGGAVVRTVHVPSSFQLAIDFALSSVAQVAWEPRAEKFAVISSSFHRPAGVELMRYGGEERELLIGTRQSETEADRLADALVFPPATVRYGATYPLVVWLTEEPPFAWNRARSLVHSAGAGVAVAAPEGLSVPFWKSALELPWVDRSRIFVVSRKGASAGVVLPDSAAVTVIAPAAGVREGHRVRRGRHTMVDVPIGTPDQIDAFAAGWIQRQLRPQR